MLIITEISPRSINKYFNREFIIVATTPLEFEGNARVSSVSESAEWTAYYSILVVCVITTPSYSSPLKFTNDPCRMFQQHSKLNLHLLNACQM